MAGSRIRLLVLCCGALAACAGDGAPQPGTAAYYAAEFEGLEIRRLGNDTACNREYQNRALSAALGGLAAEGVPRGNIEGLTVSVAGCEQGGRALASGAAGNRVWVKFKGCDGSVLYRPGAGHAKTSRCPGGTADARRSGSGDSAETKRA